MKIYIRYIYEYFNMNLIYVSYVYNDNIREIKKMENENEKWKMKVYIIIKVGTFIHFK